MVIVKIATSNQIPSEDIRTRDLKPYIKNTKDPYITAYFRINTENPMMFVIGDANEYKFKNTNYLNQPLKQNTSYTVFLRFFEYQVRS